MIDHKRQQDAPYSVLILNWRDLSHPQAGGAEKVTLEIARRWVEWGHRVTLFTARYDGASCEDTDKGVHIIRRGDQRTVHMAAFYYYHTHPHAKYDVVIDEVNTIPFFAPLYARSPVVMFSHQMAREVWHYETSFPLNVIGYHLEPFYLQAYRDTPIMTVSASTERDLRRVGLRGPCTIIPEAVDTPAVTSLPPLATKESDLTLIFVGRVVPSKRVGDLLHTLAHLHRIGLYRARLWILGAWDAAYFQELQLLLHTLHLDEHVTFFGRVDEETKRNLLSRAHLCVMTSVREGWGLVVTEANRLGTPAAVYDVGGLRDSTRHGETGLVCSTHTPEALGEAIAQLSVTPELYMRLRMRAWEEARSLNWDSTARAAWQVIETVTR